MSICAQLFFLCHHSNTWIFVKFVFVFIPLKRFCNIYFLFLSILQSILLLVVLNFFCHIHDYFLTDLQKKAWKNWKIFWLLMPLEFLIQHLALLIFFAKVLFFSLVCLVSLVWFWYNYNKMPERSFGYCFRVEIVTEAITKTRPLLRRGEYYLWSRQGAFAGNWGICGFKIYITFFICRLFFIICVVAYVKGCVTDGLLRGGAFIYVGFFAFGTGRWSNGANFFLYTYILYINFAGQ